MPGKYAVFVLSGTQTGGEVGRSERMHAGLASACRWHAGWGFVDLQELMRIEHIDVTDFVLDDGIHLSRDGNAHYARMVSNCLEELPLLAP